MLMTLSLDDDDDDNDSNETSYQCSTHSISIWVMRIDSTIAHFIGSSPGNHSFEFSNTLSNIMHRNDAIQVTNAERKRDRPSERERERIRALTGRKTAS